MEQQKQQRQTKCELFNDHFQNFKVYGIPHAQLIIADPPYNLGVNAYASNPVWYNGGDNKNGENNGAGMAAEYLGLCNKYNLAVSCIENDETASRLKDEHFSENALYYAERLMHLQSSVESFLEWLDKYCVHEHDMAVSA